MSREAHVQFCERVRGKLPRPTHSGAGGTVTYGTADDTNKYPTIGGVTQSHDSNGNLTGDGTWTFGYNTENQLTSASKTGVSASYVYDVYGRQTQKTVGSTKTRFIYAGLQRIADYDGVAGNLISRYVYGTGLDEPLIEVSSGGTLTYFHHDRIGSIIARTDATGAVTQKYKYSPFGESAALTGTSFGFQAQRYDSETGLYYCKSRYLNPATGRFLQPDPIGLAGGFNLYTFVHNDPLDKVDPLGLIDMVPRWILEGGIQLVHLGNPIAEALGIISTILGGGGGAPSPAAGGAATGGVFAGYLRTSLIAPTIDGAKGPKPTGNSTGYGPKDLIAGPGAGGGKVWTMPEGGGGGFGARPGGMFDGWGAGLRSGASGGGGSSAGGPRFASPSGSGGGGGGGGRPTSSGPSSSGPGGPGEGFPGYGKPPGFPGPHPNNQGWSPWTPPGTPNPTPNLQGNLRGNMAPPGYTNAMNPASADTNQLGPGLAPGSIQPGDFKPGIGGPNLNN